MQRVLTHNPEIAAPFVCQPLAVLLNNDARKAIHGTQGCAQIVRNGVGERVQFAIGLQQLGGAFIDALLQTCIQSPDLLFGSLEFAHIAKGDNGSYASSVR